MSFGCISEGYIEVEGGYTIVNSMSCEVLFGLARYQWECLGFIFSVLLRHGPLLPVHVDRFKC
jgi:hypothetical protein